MKIFFLTADCLDTRSARPRRKRRMSSRFRVVSSRTVDRSSHRVRWQECPGRVPSTAARQRRSLLETSTRTPGRVKHYSPRRPSLSRPHDGGGFMVQAPGHGIVIPDAPDTPAVCRRAISAVDGARRGDAALGPPACVGAGSGPRWLLGLGIAATLSANVAHGLGHAPGWRCCGRMACGSAGWVVLLMTIIRGARVPQDLPGPAGVSAGAPEADPLRVRAAEVFADERILHRHARRHRTVHPGEWAGVARAGA